MTSLSCDHIQQNISDYVLDLLSAEEKQAIARHLAGCTACREASARERQIGRLVYQTLNTAAQPKFERLQSLMPARPNRRTSILSLFTPYRQWAIASVLLVAMLGAFLFGGEAGYKGRQPGTHPATLSSLYTVETAAPLTTRSADVLFTFTNNQVNQSDNINPVDFNQPPAAPLPAAPQVTPAPAATYFQ